MIYTHILKSGGQGAQSPLDNTSMNFSNTEFALIWLIFIWTGFVRAGLGLPLMLLIGANPIYWLPIISIHLLFFHPSLCLSL